MIDATAAILTLNSSRNLFKCLNSVKKFKEILVLDGGSVDSTLQIARNFKCKIIRQDKKFQFRDKKIKDFSNLRNLILKKAKYELILMLDSDEILIQNNLRKIDFFSKSILNKNKYFCYLIPRIPILNNLYYKKSNLNPNYQARLFYKSKTKKFIKYVHETPFPINNKLNKFKIENLYIKFSADLSKKTLEEKFNYYYLMEKKMISNSFFSSLNFIFVKLLNSFKMFFKYLFKNKSNLDLKNYEKNIINNNIYYSFKLLLNKLNIIN